MVDLQVPRNCIFGMLLQVHVVPKSFLCRPTFCQDVGVHVFQPRHLLVAESYARDSEPRCLRQGLGRQRIAVRIWRQLEAEMERKLRWSDRHGRHP